MTSETFEQVLTAAQADGSINPAWKKFVNTKFFVPVAQPGAGESGGVRLRTRDSKGDGTQSIVISEVRERAEDGQGSLLAALSGADVVRLLQADAAILVALSDRRFDIAHDRVAWLRKSIEASIAKAAAARSVAPATAPAPAPLPSVAAPAAVVLEKSAPAAPAAPAPRRAAKGPLDVAALKPRNVTIARIGLQFFVPADWRESSMSNGLRFHDDSSGTVLEAVGYLKPEVSLNKWVEQRLAVVKHEMRYLKQDGEAYAINGAEWSDRVTGRAIEFTGTIPGDTVESRFLVALVRVDGIVVAITIRAPADAFEENRALYKWFLTRVELDEMVAPMPYRAPASGSGHERDAYASKAPGLFGLSMEGRIGRLRAMAYSLLVLLPMIGLTILAAVLAPKDGGTNLFFALGVGVIVSMFFCLRLMVLRMHDVNLSGKWILGFLLAVVVGGAAGGKEFTAVGTAIFWLGMIIIYCFIAGTDGENEFGDAPGPDSNLIKAGAGVFIVFQLFSIGAQLKMRSAGGYDAMRAASTSWTSADGAMVITFPAKPAEVPVPDGVTKRFGRGAVQQFGATLGKTVYSVQVIDMGNVPADPEALLQRMEDTVVGADGTLDSGATHRRLGTYAAREVKVRARDGTMRWAKMTTVETTMYMALAEAPDAKSEQAATAFINSFILNR